MSLEISPTEATLGAVVRGGRLAALGAAEWRAIESAFHERAVLIFPGQHLSREEQVAFGLRFGKLDSLVAETGTVAISNRLPDGSLRREEDPILQILRGNEGWHTDSSYMPLAAKASILSAEVVTRTGGETEWADMRAAYDALTREMQERIAPLAAYHSLKHSQAKLGHTDPGDFRYGFEDGDPPLRPLVKVHPVTGRRSLFIGRHAHGIPGMSSEASQQLLDELLANACQPPRILRHTWRPADVAIWDNRCVLHRARPYDLSVPRVMHHTRIAGDPATEAALPG